jgi:ABC transporter substrate binding protein
MVTKSRYIVVVVLLTLGLLAIVMETVSAPSVSKSLPRTRILYVADPTFETSQDGRGGVAQLRRQVERLLPQESLAWDVVAIDPDDGVALQLVIRERKPQIAVFESDVFLDGLGMRPVDAALLVSSSRSPTDLAARFEPVRRVNSIAFVSWFAADHRKWISALERMTPRPLRELVVFADTETIEAGEIEPARQVAAERGMKTELLRYDSYETFMAAWTGRIAKDAPQAVYLPISESLLIHIDEVPKIAAGQKVLAAYSRGDQVEHGGLIAVDAPTNEVHVQLARYVVLMAHGASAAMLPIAVPTRTQIALNLSAATALGLTIPYELLVEADEIFE